MEEDYKRCACLWANAACTVDKVNSMKPDELYVYLIEKIYIIRKHGII